MRIEEKTVIITYKVFDVGEIVRPTSRRSGLAPGNYTVTAYVPPPYADAEGTVYLEGYPHAVGTEYLAPVTGVHQLGEPPAGFEPILWEDATTGQEVWIWGTRDSQPHAYGPHVVISVTERYLRNPQRCRFVHYAQDLLIRSAVTEELT